MKVRIAKSNSHQWWYSCLIGSVFQVREVRAKVFNRAHTLNIFEVVGGDHDGDYIACGDAEVIS